MTNKKLTESLNQLKQMVVKQRETIELAEKSVDLAMSSILNNVPDEQMKTVQQQIKNINNVMNKAKKGENVDADIQKIKKVVKSWE